MKAAIQSIEDANANSSTGFKVSSAQKPDPENLQITVVLQNVDGPIGLDFDYWRCEAAYPNWLLKFFADIAKVYPNA